MNTKYTDINSEFFDKWVAEGWEWGQPISHEAFERALNGDWFVVLTPIKPVPRDWFCEIEELNIFYLTKVEGIVKLLKNDEFRTAMGKVDNALSKAGFVVGYICRIMLL